MMKRQRSPLLTDALSWPVRRRTRAESMAYGGGLRWRTSVRWAAAAVLTVWAGLPVRASVPSGQTPATGVVFHDANRNGLRDEGEVGLPDVLVSNQLELVKTDGAGRWRLMVDDDATIFVIKPRGWMTSVDPVSQLPRFYYTHKPAGSPKLEHAGVAPTGPLPDSIDFPLHPRAESDRFQAIFFGDTQSRNDAEIEYMAHDVIEELVGTEAAFGVTLGDIVFDNPTIYDHHNRTVALLGIPWYNVIGNHDMNYDAQTDIHSDETFESVYGPSYYSFNHGPTHFVVLDNVHWVGTTPLERGQYHGEFGSRQLEFVKNDLAFAPEGQLVVLLMHIPLPGVKDREALYRLIETRPYTLSVAAHTHSQRHEFISREDGWRGAKPHHHFVNVTVCGSWWGGAPDEYGIPHALTSDGVPNGYSIITFDGHEASIVYQAARRSPDYQMNIFAPYEIRSADAATTEVVVNVFAGSSKSTVEMRFGSAGRWTPLRHELRPDPYLERLKALEKVEPKPAGRELPNPDKSTHIWTTKLPPNPPVGVHFISVRTTDMYGQTYTAQRVIQVNP